MAVIAIMALSGTAVFAKTATESMAGSSDLMLLTLNHARTVAFSLNSPASGLGDLHSLYLLTYGAGTLKISLVNNTALEKGQEVIYFVSGLIFTTPVAPVLQYIYSTGGALTLSVTVPVISGGLLFTGILYATGGVDYPMTMVVTASLGP